MSILIAGLVIFLGIHSVSIAAHPWRDRMVNRLGQWTWKGLYSIVALLGLALIIHGYAIARLEAPALYYPPAGMRHLTLLLMLPVFPMLLAAYLPGRIKTTLKHPMLVATKLWALSHLLANGSVADVVLFGSILGWAVVDRISLKRRPARAVPALPAGKWNDLLAIAGGLLLYVLFVMGLHQMLIGVAPINMG